MRTAEDWRDEHYFRYGTRPEPGALLADVLQDMEELEASNRFLNEALIAKAQQLLERDE